MPTSHPESRDWVVTQVADMRPTSILDVGAGSVTYAGLLRPYTETIEAVEIYRPYLSQFGLADQYDVVHVDDVRTWQWPKRYGLVVCGDVLEHMTEDDALAVHAQALEHADAVLVVLPIVDYPQHGHDNPYEHHVVDDWDHGRAMDRFRPDAWWTGEVVGAYLTRSR